MEKTGSFWIPREVWNASHIIVMCMLIVDVISFLGSDFLLYEFVKVVIGPFPELRRTIIPIFGAERREILLVANETDVQKVMRCHSEYSFRTEMVSGRSMEANFRNVRQNLSKLCILASYVVIFSVLCLLDFHRLELVCVEADILVSFHRFRGHDVFRYDTVADVRGHSR